MKRFLLFIVLSLGTSLVFHGFVSAQRMMGDRPMKRMVAPEPTGAALWDHLKNVDYTKRWRMWPGKKALYPSGKTPHGAFLTTYVNGPAYRAIVAKKGMLPYRSIIAKENYGQDKKLAAITVMYKVKGYNPGAADWFWAEYSPDGKIMAEGKVDMCISCHAKGKDNNYIMTEPLK